ncbi:uncharacterized protein LOC135378552 isoform X2 [Ornithodoros turicata]|uniref:uncharacterized protein LOC135378552 isoform X2 n=1 Tax=Ornithodoros turicata TaxID=34597 RepID=UPI00313A3A7D
MYDSVITEYIIAPYMSQPSAGPASVFSSQCRPEATMRMVHILASSLMVAGVYATQKDEKKQKCMADENANAWAAITGPKGGKYLLYKSTSDDAKRCAYVTVPTRTYQESADFTSGYKDGPTWYTSSDFVEAVGNRMKFTDISFTAESMRRKKERKVHTFFVDETP